MHNASLLKGYENTRLVHYNDLSELSDRIVDYRNLPEFDSPGVLKYNGRDKNGNLLSGRQRKPRSPATLLMPISILALATPTWI